MAALVASINPSPRNNVRAILRRCMRKFSFSLARSEPGGRAPAFDTAHHRTFSDLRIVLMLGVSHPPLCHGHVTSLYNSCPGFPSGTGAPFLASFARKPALSGVEAWGP